MFTTPLRKEGGKGGIGKGSAGVCPQKKEKSTFAGSRMLSTGETLHLDYNKKRREEERALNELA